jgi:hypothetical protein
MKEYKDLIIGYLIIGIPLALAAISILMAIFG